MDKEKGKINNAEVNMRLPLMLAPMAGVADLAFREICAENGAEYVCTEMVSAKALCYKDKKTQAILKRGKRKMPLAVQIFGSEPDVMAEAANIALEISGADVVDINMGCPMPKITSNGEGSALMKNPKLAFDIISAVKKAVKAPVTVKHRIGWNSECINAAEFAKNAESAGVDAICVHGRTAAQLYSGKADWKMIAEVKKNVSVPVFANGDVCSADDAIDILSQTGADGIAIARGALGNPWLFGEIKAALGGEAAKPAVSFKERIKTALGQLELTAEYKGERVAALECRRHLCWYLKNIAGAKAYRTRLCQVTSLAEAYKIADEMNDIYEKYGSLNINAE